MANEDSLQLKPSQFMFSIEGVKFNSVHEYKETFFIPFRLDLFLIPSDKIELAASKVGRPSRTAERSKANNIWLKRNNRKIKKQSEMV